MKIKSTLPKGDVDGLTPVESRIERLQLMETVIVAVLSTESRIEDVETGAVQLVLKLRRVEAMTDPNDEHLARMLLQKRFEKRTGVTTLPINDDRTFKHEFYAAAQARGWTVEDDGTIKIPGGGLTVVDESADVAFDPTTGEVLDDDSVPRPERTER